MRNAIVVAVLLLAGCDRTPPPKPAVKLPDTPSILVYESAKSSGRTDETMFDLPKDRLYVINGSWSNRHDPRKGDYQRPGQFTFERANDADVDPKEIADHINRWIDRAGIRVLNQVDAPASPERIQRTIDYQTERTTGHLAYSIVPGAPHRKVTVTFTIQERRTPMKDPKAR